MSSFSGAGEITYPCWLVCAQRGRRVRYRVWSEPDLTALVRECREATPPVLVLGVLLHGVLRLLPDRPP